LKLDTYTSEEAQGEFWTQKAHNISDNRGKLLRRDGFGLAEEKYSMLSIVLSLAQIILILIAAEYKPILEEVEKILAEAGLDEEEIKKGAALGGGTSLGQSRNRR
jgi:ABC-type lipoprotein export system ATPase subunit